MQYTRLSCNCEFFPANYSSFLQLQNFSTSNDLLFTVYQYYLSNKNSTVQIFILYGGLYPLEDELARLQNLYFITNVQWHTHKIIMKCNE